MSATWRVVVAIACGYLLLWTLVSALFARSTPHLPMQRAAVLAALIIGPILVVSEVWFLAFAVGTMWPPMPWVIGGAGALAAAVLALLQTTQTPRLTPEIRRRATINAVLLVVIFTLAAEAFVFKDAWMQWSSILLSISLAVVHTTVSLQRRARDRRAKAGPSPSQTFRS